MKYFSQIFRDTMSLHVGTNSQCFHEYLNFFHVESIFNDKWYNLIIPKIADSTNFDMKAVDEIIEGQSKRGKQISFYVNQELLDSYQKLLNVKGYEMSGDDCYMSKSLSDITKPTFPDGYKISDQYNLDNVINVLEKCFSGWTGEDTYSKFYEDYKTCGQEDRLFETYAIHHENNVVGAASISLDKNLNLGYLHNDGVLEDHRNRGLHAALIQERCNFCLNGGVTNVVTLVEENSGSFRNYQKQGFTLADKFFVFIKK